MSKERELLKRVIETDDGNSEFYINGKLEWDIKELLAQPDTEQDPVAWISLSDIQWMNIVNDQEILKLTGGRHNSEDAVNLAVKMTEAKCKANNSNSIPTRKPLSDDEIDLGYQDSPGNYYDLAFRDGVRFAEKYHKIGINNV